MTQKEAKVMYALRSQDNGCPQEGMTGWNTGRISRRLQVLSPVPGAG